MAGGHGRPHRRDEQQPDPRNPRATRRGARPAGTRRHCRGSRRRCRHRRRRGPLQPPPVCPSSHWPARSSSTPATTTRRETDTSVKSTTAQPHRAKCWPATYPAENRQGVQHDHRPADRPARHPSGHTAPSRPADRRRRHLRQARRDPPYRRDRIRRRRRRTTRRRPAAGPQHRMGPSPRHRGTPRLARPQLNATHRCF